MSSSGCATDKMKRLFNEFGLPYDLLLGSDEILKGDGHIDFFADHFSLAKKVFCQQATLVGDGTTDMKIARGNSIFAVGITNSLPAATLEAAGANAIISNFSQVLEFTK